MAELLPTRYQTAVFYVVPLMHLTGFLGAQFPAAAPLFRALTPFHLTLTLLFLLSFHANWNKAAIFYTFLATLTGFVVEVLGVQTGLIFGSYHYGATLGWKWLEVPLLIGVNWFVLTYCAGIVANQLPIPNILKAAAAAALVTILDVFIEPVAIRNDFWNWQNNIIPLQNYAAWFLISWLLLFIFYKLPFRKENKLAALLLVVQAVFFAAQCLTYWLD